MTKDLKKGKITDKKSIKGECTSKWNHSFANKC